MLSLKLVDKFIQYQLEVNEVLWITPPATSQALLAIMVELILVLVVVWHKLVVEWEPVVVVNIHRTRRAHEKRTKTDNFLSMVWLNYKH
jgi:hypothetical protein